MTFRATVAVVVLVAVFAAVLYVTNRADASRGVKAAPVKAAQIRWKEFVGLGELMK